MLVMLEVGERIKRGRLALGDTREQFAHRAGLTMVTVWRIETGRNLPTLETLLAIAAALDVPVEELVAVGAA